MVFGKHCESYQDSVQDSVWSYCSNGQNPSINQTEDKDFWLFEQRGKRKTLFPNHLSLLVFELAKLNALL